MAKVPNTAHNHPHRAHHGTETEAEFGTDSTGKKDLRKSMSDNVAFALIVYTALNIFATVAAIKMTGMKAYALLILVVLVAAIIPACRSFEKKWRLISDEKINDPAMQPKLNHVYRRDRLMLWVLAIGLPFGLTAMFRALASLTS